MEKDTEKTLFWALMIGFAAFAAFQVAREVNLRQALK